MEGISRREAARRAGIDESTVRRAIDSGALDRALLDDGSLEPAKALKALAENVQRGKVAPSNLTTAKTRRLRAQVGKLDDELVALRASTILTLDVEALLGEQRAIIEKQLAGVPWDAANAAAGKPASVAHLALRQLVLGALERTVDDDAENPGPDPDEPEFDLGALSPNDLTARRMSLQAEKIEIETAVARGEARLVAEVVADFEERLGVTKSLLMALPDRLAQAAEQSTPSEFEALVAAEIDGALTELNQSSLNA